jgi:hypothetical protein
MHSMRQYAHISLFLSITISMVGTGNLEKYINDCGSHFHRPFLLQVFYFLLHLFTLTKKDTEFRKKNGRINNGELKQPSLNVIVIVLPS